MAQLHRVLAVLNLSRHVPDVIKTAKAFVTALTNNSYFPTPAPTLVAVTQHISDLESAETAAKSKAHGLVQVRDVKLNTLLSDLHALKAYVQLCADANLENAAAMIQSASLGIRKATTRTKSDFSAVQGASSGEVHLAAKAGKARASYDWQISTDGKTWTDLPSTLQAKAQVHGLTPATTYSFRHRKLTKTGREDWGQVVTLLVK